MVRLPASVTTERSLRICHRISGHPLPLPVIERSTIPDCLEINATSEDNEIMGIRHRELPVWGVQFHPESLATENGIIILKNFLGPARTHSCGIWNPTKSMRCPKCSSEELKVLETRAGKVASTRRRRECLQATIAFPPSKKSCGRI